MHEILPVIATVLNSFEQSVSNFDIVAWALIKIPIAINTIFPCRVEVQNLFAVNAGKEQRL